ncbi:potassium channel family protein [Oceanobacillus halotolerans]|uniref:potassium channel family protein n=1 Tax=Oceanobacillus halotolerans TaxID=2663380 RepID=UPI00299EC6CA|nr:potassium channel family protein [Oceanobacillus halotolerans]
MNINFELVKTVYYRIPKVIRLLMTVFILMFLFGSAIHFVEPAQFPTIFDGIWWAFVTGATVGYGDYVPLTVRGKIVAVLLFLTGGALLAYYISTLSAVTVERERNLAKGKIAFRGMNHLVFIGWNDRTRQLIEMTTKNETVKVVLIDRTLQHLPNQDHPVHFIHGDPAEDAVLEKANISKAKRVVITADISKKEKQADNLAILTTVAIRGNNPDVPIIVEILSKSQVENALRAGANTIIRSNDFMSALLFHELLRVKTATPFEDILHLLTKQQFHHSKVSDKLADKTFYEIAAESLKEQRIILGILRGDEWKMNPSGNLKLQKGDIIISLTPWN